MAPETQPASRPGEKRGSPSVITPRLGETSAKRRKRGRHSAAAQAASPPPPPPQWQDGWEEVAENEYSPAALLVIAERQRRRQRKPGAAAAAAAASSGGDAPKERRLRVDAAVLEGFSEAERRGLPHCMSKFREKGADGRRAYCDALLVVQEITDPSHPAKQSGLQQGRAHEWGLFARRALVRGTLLGELTGLVCTGEEADAAAAADPRGLGGLRADKIKSLSMTVPREDDGRAAAGGGSERGSAPGWSQELVIDGAAKSCMLRFVNSHEGVRPAPNTACVEAEDVAAGTVHVFMVTIASVAEGEELLLDYGPHFLRHIREEAQRAAALCALERQVAELQAANAELVQQTTQHQAHEQLQEQAYLDLLEEYRALQQRQQQQQREAQAAADQRVAVAEARAAKRVAAVEAGAAQRAAAAEAGAGKLQRRLAAAEEALAAAKVEAAAAVERESASLAQFCTVASQREALLGAQAQAALQKAAAQLEAKNAEVVAQRAAAEEARAALAAGQQHWETERGLLKELLHKAEQGLGELQCLLNAGSLSSQAAAALDAATSAFDAAATAAAAGEAGEEAATQQVAGGAEEGGSGEDAVTAAAAVAAAMGAEGGAIAADATNQSASGADHAAPGESEVLASAATVSVATGEQEHEHEQQQQQQQPQQQAPRPAEAPCSSPAAEAVPPSEGAVLTATAVAAALAAQEEALQAGEMLGQVGLAQDALGLLGGYGSSSDDEQ